MAKRTNSKDPVMLIYNKQLSVSPLTTHIPISKVPKNIKKRYNYKSKKIDKFYKQYIKKNLDLELQG